MGSTVVVPVVCFMIVPSNSFCCFGVGFLSTSCSTGGGCCMFQFIPASLLAFCIGFLADLFALLVLLLVACRLGFLAVILLLGFFSRLHSCGLSSLACSLAVLSFFFCSLALVAVCFMIFLPLALSLSPAGFGRGVLLFAGLSCSLWFWYSGLVAVVCFIISLSPSRFALAFWM